MKILRAIGLGIVLVIIRIVMPDVFHALQDTLLKFFDLTQNVFSFGSKIFDPASGNDIIVPASINLVP